MTRRFTLANSICRVVLTDLGARLLELHVPDRDGNLADVVLGRPAAALADDDTYMGATVGRCANRIRSGLVEIDGVAAQLTRNEGDNHLHGGRCGFDHRVWSSRTRDDEVTFGRVSPAGEEGYPGTLTVGVTYRLTEAALTVEIEATTDAPTIVNVVHHSYVNLGGHDAGTIDGHVLQVNGSAYLPVDDDALPTGEVRPVDGTPFDLRSPTAIGGNRIRAGGFDHNWVLDGHGMRDVASVTDPGSGRRMFVSTDQPGLQVYTGGYLAGATGKDGVGEYGAFAGLALEAQNFPDAVNHPHFPSAILRPGEFYRSTVRFDFSPVSPATPG